MTYSTLLHVSLSLMLPVLLPLCLAFHDCGEGPCQKGQFLKHEADGTPVCQPCPPGTYMDQDNHMCVSCFPCMEVKEYNQQRALKECTPDANRVVVCKDGYFRVPNGDPTLFGFCEKCTRCADDEIISKECDLPHDTLCSPYPGTEETLKDESHTSTAKADNFEVKKVMTHTKLDDWDVQKETALERLPMTIFLTTSPFLIVFSVKVVPILFNKLIGMLGRLLDEEDEEGKKENMAMI